MWHGTAVGTSSSTGISQFLGCLFSLARTQTLYGTGTLPGVQSHFSSTGFNYLTQQRHETRWRHHADFPS